MTSVGPPEFDVGEVGPSSFDEWSLTPGPESDLIPDAPSDQRPWVLAGIAALLALVGLLVFLALARDPADPIAANPPSTTAAPATTEAPSAPETAAEPRATEAPAADEPRYYRGLVDPVVAQITPHGNGYVGFVAAAELGQLAVVSSSDGFTWTRANAIDAQGLPDRFDPLGMWSSLVGELFAFGRYDDRYGLAISADHGGRWDVLFEVEETIGTEIAPVFALTLGPGGVWLQVAELDDDGNEVIQRSFEAVRFEGWSWREIDGDLGPLQGATWSSRGLLALRAPGSLEEFVTPDWRSLAQHDLTTGVVDDMSIAGLQEPVIALMHSERQILAVGLTQSYRYDVLTDAWTAIGPVPITPFDRQELVEVVTTNDGVALLFFDEFVPVERGRYTVVASHDLLDWTTVRITEEFVTLTIKTIGDEEVLLEGVIDAAGPRRIRMPTAGAS